MGFGLAGFEHPHIGHGPDHQAAEAAHEPRVAPSGQHHGFHGRRPDLGGCDSPQARHAAGMVHVRMGEQDGRGGVQPGQAEHPQDPGAITGIPGVHQHRAVLAGQGIGVDAGERQTPYALGDALGGRGVRACGHSPTSA